MKFLEKDLEEILFEQVKGGSLKSSYNKKLIEKGLLIRGLVKRQLSIGSYGIADLVSFYIKSKSLGFSQNAFVITIYELKKDKIGISAFLQACGYVKGIERYLLKRGFNQRIEFNIVLIGKDIDTTGNFCYLPEIFNNIKYYTYNYEFEGITFKNKSEYSLIDENF